MNQNKPFYVALVAATCVVMLLCGFILNFAWSMRSEVDMAKSNIVNERQYSIEQIKKAGNQLVAKQKEIQASSESLEKQKAELVEIQNALKQTIENYELTKNITPAQVLKDERNARAFLVIWQSTLEEKEPKSFLVSKKEVESSEDGSVSFYHTHARVFEPSGLIAYANTRLPDNKGVKTVETALKVVRYGDNMIVIPIY